MEMIMDCFFDQVFAQMDRSSLLAKYKRKQLVEYLSTVIKGCSMAEGDPKEVCRTAVVSSLNFHSQTKGKNGDVCLMGKYHNVLYVSARLAFDWGLDDSETVGKLLTAMFQCERSFDRLVSGAIFGPVASGVISGWKSDFDTRLENIEALRYFLDHSLREKLEFRLRGTKFRLVDVPMESYGRSTPASVSVQVTRPDVLHLLLQYGAKVYIEQSPCPLEVLLKRLSDSPDEIPQGLKECLHMIMSVITRIPEIYNKDNPYIEALLPGLRFIPEERLQVPAELKHLCRITIRNALYENFQLPIGIKELPIPQCLQNYVNIVRN